MTAGPAGGYVLSQTYRPFDDSADRVHLTAGAFHLTRAPLYDEASPVAPALSTLTARGNYVAIRAPNVLEFRSSSTEPCSAAWSSSPLIVDALPVTPTGKVRKFELCDPIGHGQLREIRCDDQDYRAPGRRGPMHGATASRRAVGRMSGQVWRPALRHQR